MRRIGSLFLALALAAFFTGSAMAAYPEKTVKFLVPFPPGGGADQVGRLIEKDFKEEFGQPLSFIYRTGADGGVGATELKSMPADGYAMGTTGFPLLLINAIAKKGQYTMKDFDYLCAPSSDVVILVNRAGDAVKSFKEFVDLVKKTPNKISVAAVERNGPSHLATLMLKQAGLPINIVPYDGASKGVTALLGKHIDYLMTLRGASMSAMSKLQLLAVATPERVNGLDAPTMKEMGYDVVSPQNRLIFAPAGMPAEVKARLVEGLKKIYSKPEVIERHKKAGFDIEFIGTEEVTKMINDFVPRAEELLKLAKSLE